MDQSDLIKAEQDAKARIMERTALGIRIGLEALSVRLLTVIALLLNAGITGWSIADPRWERLASATVFALFSFAVIHMKLKGD